ncbi:TonB-dependent receptor [Asticcacaulis excentricus]|uniref:Zinc-regulated outer membrane receptor n=1 Tax=Asticcacaulis excentricus TaxID=78587 RepID=A0A3G9FWZ2_9CAUL|nr:TonB-dependent receptor [Asticcacaulis excentricus]BBF79622.1 zinc-regulated outer membrane receptor [Asticcacaulis excentricus]
MQTRMVLTLTVSLAALVAFTPVLAQSSSPTPQKDEDITEIVVTGTAYGVSKDALMSNVDVLTRTTIDQKPAESLGDMLATLPGVRSSAFAPGASRPVIRGLDGFRVLLLNNGMGAIDASAVSPDHATGTDPVEAQRIEVLRGPSALIYGGNAIGGIVNIIDDRIASAPAKDGVEGRFTAQASSVDNGKQLGLNVKTGQGPWVFTADALKRKSDDYKTPVGPESRRLTDAEGEEPDTRDRQENSAVDLSAYGAGLSYVGDFGFAGLSVKHTDTTYGVPGHSHAEDASDHEEGGDHAHEEEGPVTIGLKQTRYDVRSSFNIAFAGFNKLTADAGYTDYKHTEFEGEEVGTRFLSDGYEARVNLIRQKMGDVSGAVGFNVLERHFEAIGAEAFVPSSTTREFGTYAQSRIDRGAWGIEGGLRGDRKEITSAGFSKAFDNLSGSLGGFWKPSDHAFFGLSVTRSERAPSDVELLADGPHAGTGAYEIGNAALKSETGYSVEATGHWQMDSHSAFSLDAHLYSSRFDNFIDLRPTGDNEDGLPVYRYVQTDADFWGFELEGGVNLWSRGAQAVRLDLAYDYVRGKSDLGDIARIAPSALTATLGYEGERWKSHLEVRHVAAADTHLAAFETPTDAYTAVNVFGSYWINPKVSVFAELRNATDEEIREHTSVQKDILVGAGRNLRAGLTYRF